MKNAHELKESLVGQEMTFRYLDRIMVENGYYSEDENINNNQVFSELLESECIAYVLNSECMSDYISVVDFKVITINGEDELNEATYVKITDVR